MKKNAKALDHQPIGSRMTFAANPYFRLPSYIIRVFGPKPDKQLGVSVTFQTVRRVPVSKLIGDENAETAPL